MRWFLALCLVLLAACDREGLGPSDGGGDAGVQPDVNFVPNTQIQIRWVVDGDTVDVAAGANVLTPDGRPMADERIRLLGIQAPEIAHEGTPADCWGDEAHDAARQLLQGRTVTLEYDPSHALRGDFGRLLAYVVLSDGQVANEVLIREGHARSFRAFPHQKLTEYNALEAQAKSSGIGLWGCP